MAFHMIFPNKLVSEKIRAFFILVFHPKVRLGIYFIQFHTSVGHKGNGITFSQYFIMNRFVLISGLDPLE